MWCNLKKIIFIKFRSFWTKTIFCIYFFVFLSITEIFRYSTSYDSLYINTNISTCKNKGINKNTSASATSSANVNANTNKNANANTNINIKII